MGHVWFVHLWISDEGARALLAWMVAALEQNSVSFFSSAGTLWAGCAGGNAVQPMLSSAAAAAQQGVMRATWAVNL